MTVTLDNRDNVKIKILENGKTFNFDITSLANNRRLELIRKEYPWVLKILLWSKWIRPSGKTDTLSWVVPLMVNYRNEKNNKSPSRTPASYRRNIDKTKSPIMRFLDTKNPSDIQNLKTGLSKLNWIELKRWKIDKKNLYK